MRIESTDTACRANFTCPSVWSDHIEPEHGGQVVIVGHPVTTHETAAAVRLRRDIVRAGGLDDHGPAFHPDPDDASYVIAIGATYDALILDADATSAPEGIVIMAADEAAVTFHVTAAHMLTIAGRS